MSAAEPMKLVRVVETCIAAPSQWDAWTEDGTQLYMRYRYGRGRVEIGDGASLSARILAEWNDGTGSSYISLSGFLQTVGLQLADGADVQEWRPDDVDDLPEPAPLSPGGMLRQLLEQRRAQNG